MVGKVASGQESAVGSSQSEGRPHRSPVHFRQLAVGSRQSAVRGRRMEDGGWRMEDGGWRMEDGGWRMEDGDMWIFFTIFV